MTRRDLVKTAAAGAAWAAASRARAQGANEKILIGTIGCGGQAVDGHIAQFLRHPDAEVIALADVDQGKLDHAAEKIEKRTGRRPKTFRDFRQLLDLKELNAVNIGTPDHWHAIPFILACQAGKDVYCEKPISHSIVEGRAMVNAALAHKRVVQIGTQQRSGEHFQKAIEIVQSGKLGRIVETCTWNCANEKGIGNPPDGDPPANVDYDFWLGPAPKRPFNPNRFHFHWRWFFDYGGGKVADWNVHLQDIVHLAMNVWSPRSVVMFGQKAGDDNTDTPDVVKAVYEFDAPQGPFTQTYTWRATNSFSPDGNPKHASHGLLICGQKGNLFVDRGGWELIPEKNGGLEAGSGGGSQQIEPHVRNFLDCVKSRAKTASDIESMHLTTAACHLANVSYKAGRKIYWDAKQEKCFRDRELKVADDPANGLLGREYRAPWKLPG
jgi:predicted dehydrogenase